MSGIPSILRIVPPLLALSLAACSATPAETAAAARHEAPDRAFTVYALRRGRHTDLILPAEPLPAALSVLRAEFAGARYLAFGFGDRQYVLATHKNLAHALLAPFPGAGLLLVTGLRGPPAETYGAEHLAALPLRRSQLEAIGRYVSDSLQRDEHGGLPPYLPGKYPGNVYYASTRTYYALFTCNTWTAEALKSGGVPVRSFAVVFAPQLWDQVLAIVAQARGGGADGPAEAGSPATP